MREIGTFFYSDEAADDENGETDVKDSGDVTGSCWSLAGHLPKDKKYNQSRRRNYQLTVNELFHGILLYRDFLDYSLYYNKGVVVKGMVIAINY